MDKNKLLDYALKYLRSGISVIPVGKNKRPLIEWKEFQSRRASEEEVKNWFTKFSDIQIGFVTGKISNLSVVDIEKFGDPSFLRQDTFIVETGGGGYHYYYQYDPVVPTKARGRVLIDFRSEGGYVVAPFSETDKGRYTIRQDVSIKPFPRDCFPELTEEKVNIWSYPSVINKAEIKTELQDYPGYGPGQRNDEMTKYIGYVITQFHPADWDTKVWTIIESANQKNKPPLGLNELRNSFESVKKIERRNNPLGRIYGRNSEVVKEQQEEEKILVLGTEEDKIKHIATVAKESNLDVTDFYKLEMPCFDEALGGGVNIGDVVVIAGQTGNGKRLDIETPILTKNGWIKNGDIKTGDKIIGRDGKETKVLCAHPIEEGISYKIVFSDNTYVIADGDHLWTVQSQKQKYKNGGYQILTTKEILSKGLFFTNKKTSYKWFIPLVDPVIFTKKKLAIKPYTLGVLLANGSMSSSTVNITTNDKYIGDKIIEESKDIDICEYVCKNQTSRRWMLKNIHNMLKDINLDCLKSDEKFIPNEYLFSSIEDRISLLNGLMDCDGYVKKNKKAIYSTVSEKLANNISDLIRSLGGIAKIKKENRTKGKNGYIVSVWTPMNPFSLKRKADNYTPRPGFKAISSITKDKKCKMRCLTVNNPEGLYVIKDFTVTHNTSLAQDWSMSLTRGEKSLKSLWFSYEVLPQHLWNKFKEMGATEEDYLFTPAKNTTGNVEWIENKIKEGKELYGTRAVFIDHLGFLLPKTNGILGKNLSSNYSSFITQIVRDLKTIAKNQEVIIFLPVHMKKAETRSRSSDLDDIKDSSGISQESDAVFLIERERNTNKDATDYYTDITKITLAKNRKTGKTVVAKFNMLNGRFAYSQLNEEELKVKNNYERLSSLGSDDDD